MKGTFRIELEWHIKQVQLFFQTLKIADLMNYFQNMLLSDHIMQNTTNTNENIPDAYSYV